MIHALDPGIDDSAFPILDIVPAEDFLRASHAFSLRVAGWSMYPTILKGDRLILDPPDRIRPGDIVVFPFMDALVCHRVIGIENGEIVHTQGDSVDTQDRPVRMQEILGKVATILRGHREFAPASAPRPSLTTLARKKMDVFRTGLREQLTSWALTVLAFLKQRALANRLATLVLTRYVRFYLGVRAPVQSVHAYRFMPLPGAGRDDMIMNELPPDYRPTDDVLIQARFGRHRLGTWHPASGTMRIRLAAAGLGLEDSLRAVYRRLPLPHPTQLHRSRIPASAGR